MLLLSCFSSAVVYNDTEQYQMHFWLQCVQCLLLLVKRDLLLPACLSGYMLAMWHQHSSRLGLWQISTVKWLPKMRHFLSVDRSVYVTHMKAFWTGHITTKCWTSGRLHYHSSNVTQPQVSTIQSVGEEGFGILAKMGPLGPHVNFNAQSLYTHWWLETHLDKQYKNLEHKTWAKQPQQPK